MIGISDFLVAKKISKIFLEGTKIGTLSLFSFLGVSAFVGGPVWIGLILGLIMAVLVRKHPINLILNLSMNGLEIH